MYIIIIIINESRTKAYISVSSGVDNFNTNINKKLNQYCFYTDAQYKYTNYTTHLYCKPNLKN